VPIKPDTDGALLLALINEIIKQGLFDRDFLINNTNSAELVNMDKNSSEHGMFMRFEVPKEEGCFDAQNKLDNFSILLDLLVNVCGKHLAKRRVFTSA